MQGGVHNGALEKEKFLLLLLLSFLFWHVHFSGSGEDAQGYGKFKLDSSRAGLGREGIGTFKTREGRGAEVVATSQGPLCQISMTRRVGFPRIPDVLFHLLTLKGGAVTRQPGGASLGSEVEERGFFPFSLRVKGSHSEGDEKLGKSTVSRTVCVTSFVLLYTPFLWLLGMGRPKLISLIPGH